MAGYRADLAAIPADERDRVEPFWNNTWFSGLDAASLYGFLRIVEPSRYFEIGSGNSTKFASRAKRDGSLATRITSIDPDPRADVEELCDRVIRKSLDRADIAHFDELERGDVLFFDGTHRVFMNSDATVFFLEVVPKLAPGLLVGVHDIALPRDYHPDFKDRYYSEQYLLAAYLLAGGSRIRPVLPCAYVSDDAELSDPLRPLWEDPRLDGVPSGGAAFWFEIGEGPA